GLERSDLTGHAERSVIHVTPGAAGDLAKLGGGEIAIVLPVEFADAGEGDMVEVEIKSHADRVGGDEEVDVAVLVERDLGIERAGRERGDKHGGAARATTTPA